MKDLIAQTIINKTYKKKYTKEFVFFFYQDFLSQTLTTHRTAGEGRGPSFIPLYHFHPLTNIQTFICNFARGMTIIYFSSQRLNRNVQIHDLKVQICKFENRLINEN